MVINYKKLFFILLIYLGVINTGLAQEYTLGGYIYDQETGESLIGANVLEVQTENGTTTNKYGYFSIKVPEGQVILQVTYVGYKPYLDTLNVQSDKQLKITMDPNVQLDMVEIRENTKGTIEEQSQMSKVNLPVEQIKKIPKLFGDVNVMRAAQLMPGIQSGGEGSSNLLVRGGSPDQNLILLDGVPLYHVSHLGGLFSVFNADAIKSMEIYKGGFPARFGGRLSSVVDIRMKDGNMKEFQGEGSIGLLSSKLSLEGPIIKDKTSFMFSARRSYIDLLLKPLSSLASDGEATFGYNFYDLNAKVNHKFSDKDRLFLSFYSGDDRVTTEANVDDGSLENFNAWGNLVASLRWNHVFNQDLFGNLTANFTRYRFKVDVEQTNNRLNLSNYLSYRSNVRDWSLSGDFDYYPSDAHNIKFGVKGTYHTFTPGITTFESANTNDTTIGSQTYRNLEGDAYFEDDWEISDALKANIGIHGSLFNVPGDLYTSIQPRLSARYMLGDQSSLKASFATMNQFVHLLTTTSASLPTDLWVPSTTKVPPKESLQVAGGYSRSFAGGLWEMNVEGYYKTMEGLITYSEGTNFFSTSQNWQEKIEINGKGKSFGAEFRFQKKQGDFTGWIAYTLARSTRQFENINFGEPYPFRYDRRHDIGLTLNYDINEKVSVSGTWVYGTGQAVTLPIARYNSSGLLDRNNRGGLRRSPINIYEGKNRFRMKPYHRLDLSIDFNKKTGFGERTWSLGLYNAYNRQNPYYYFFESSRDGSQDLKQFSLFPILPSTSISFKF